MLGSIKSFFDDDGLMPHGMCLLWRPDILWIQVIADSLTVLAYFSIPAALIYFARRRRDFPHVWILYLFGAFIVWCGLTHATSIWTLWVPAYGVQAVVKVITAAVSLATAATLWPLMPRALAIPSIGELQAKNVQLETEISERVHAERRLQELTVSLEKRVEKRTRELTDTNAHLEYQIERRRRGEEQLIKAKAKAEAANRAKTIFLAGVSHELRSPLNSILGFAQLLDQFYSQGLDERQRDYLRNIQTSGSLLQELIERLLDLSMVESGRSDIRVESTDVAECLHKVRAMLEPTAQKADVSLSLTISETDPAIVVADPTRLLQIMINLGSNAIKYNRPGGRVDISAVIASDVDLVVRFADTGIGIPAQLCKHIFEPFNRMNQERSTIHGTGIGLALSKRLAHAMGADLTFESVEGQGSTFDLTLQRAQQFMVVSREEEAEFVELPHCRLLYIDDDPRNRSLIDLYARQRPELTVTHAADLGEVRAQIAVERPDVILLDINLPVWKGVDLISKIAEERATSNIRVIGVAAAVNPQSRRYAENANMVALLAKSIAFRDLALAICKAMTP